MAACIFFSDKNTHFNMLRFKAPCREGNSRDLPIAFNESNKCSKLTPVRRSEAGYFSLGLEFFGPVVWEV